MKIALVLTAFALAITPDLARAKGDTESKDKGKESANTVTGCLSKSTTGTEGSYTLTTKTKEVDVRGAQLAEHVGHEVKLTGSWMNDAAHSASATADKQATRTGKGSSRHFMVSDIQHIAATCTTKQETKQQKQETKQDTQPAKQDKPQKQY